MVDEDKNLGETVADRETEQGVLRALDAEVALKVLGWTIAPEGDRWRVSRTGEYVNSWCVDSPDLARLDDDVGARLYGRYAMPRYSADIAAAMEVVEKMWRTGWQIEIVNCYRHYTLVSDNVCAWWVRFILNENDMENWSAEAETLPLAICRAALKATECLSINNETSQGQAS